MAAVDDRQGLVEGLKDLRGFVGSGLDPAVGLGALSFDALLLGLHDLFGDAAPVVELDELLLLILEGAQPAAVMLGLFACDYKVDLEEEVYTSAICLILRATR